MNAKKAKWLRFWVKQNFPGEVNFKARYKAVKKYFKRVERERKLG